RVRPVLEGGRERGEVVRLVVVVAVRDRDPVSVRVQAGHARQDPTGRVRDQDRVVVRLQRPVVSDEVEQVRHLLEVGRDARVVAPEVRVVEDDVDDVLHLVVLAAERTAGRCRRGLAAARGDGRGRGENTRGDQARNQQYA